MLIVEITTYAELDDGTNDSYFVRRYTMTRQVLAAFWTVTLGVPDDQTTPVATFISGVTINRVTRCAYQASLADCQAQEQSFYWDGADILYVHFPHALDEWCAFLEFSSPLGFTDKRLIYIDDICYEPLLRGSPSIAQQQDWLNYDQLSLVNGAFQFDNIAGTFDFAILTPIFGNDVLLYYLMDTGAENYVRADLVPMASFYVDNYSHTLKMFSVGVQDKRVAQNVMIPAELFTQSEYPTLDDQYESAPIPLAYGTIRASTAIPVDLDAVAGVTFRQALLLSLLGTVEVYIDQIWYPLVPLSSNLARGEFTLDYDAATDDQGNPYPCRVSGSVGIPVTHASDVIVDLNERHLGIVFNASNYDTTEWATEEVALAPIGIVFPAQVELFEAIRRVQGGANVGFRYEIAADGRRTIRVNDWLRATSRHVVAAEVGNADEMPVSSTDEDIALEVKVTYAPDFNSDRSLTVRDNSNAASVLSTFRMRTLFEHDTYLLDPAAAGACALWYAGRLDAIHGTGELVLRGIDKLLTRIYDILEVELTPGFVDADAGTVAGRHYYGIWRVQVLAVDPNEGALTNAVKAILIQEVGAT